MERYADPDRAGAVDRPGEADRLAGRGRFLVVNGVEAQETGLVPDRGGSGGRVVDHAGRGLEGEPDGGQGRIVVAVAEELGEGLASDVGAVGRLEGGDLSRVLIGVEVGREEIGREIDRSGRGAVQDFGQPAVAEGHPITSRSKTTAW